MIRALTMCKNHFQSDSESLLGKNLHTAYVQFTLRANCECAVKIIRSVRDGRI